MFGHFYGECFGERCVEMYKLIPGEGQLQEDLRDAYPDHTAWYEGAFVPLSDSLYQQVKDLPASIPAQLYQERDRVIGQPDAGDWGGYYLEVNQNGKRQFWLIDKPKANLPAYLHAFVDALEGSIQKLK